MIAKGKGRVRFELPRSKATTINAKWEQKIRNRMRRKEQEKEERKCE